MTRKLLHCLRRQDWERGVGTWSVWLSAATASGMTFFGRVLDTHTDQNATDARMLVHSLLLHASCAPLRLYICVLYFVLYCESVYCENVYIVLYIGVLYIRIVM